MPETEELRLEVIDTKTGRVVFPDEVQAILRQEGKISEREAVATELTWAVIARSRKDCALYILGMSYDRRDGGEIKIPVSSRFYPRLVSGPETDQSEKGEA